MRNKIGLFLGSTLTALGGLVGVAHAQVSEASTTAALASVVTSVSTIAGAIIVTVLAFVGLLIGAGWGWRFLKRHIGKRI